MNGIKHFTAARIAACLNLTRQAVLLRLANTPHTLVNVRGQPARAWAIAALPQTLRSELAEAAARRGLRSIEELFADPPKPYAPPLPWAAIAPQHQANAQKLCAALAPALARQHQLPGPDLMDQTRAGYRQTFGHQIEDGKLRYLLDRTTKRDNGFEQWQRPDLYLDDAAFHVAPSTAPPVHQPGLHDALQEMLSTVKDKSNPTPDDRRHIFPAAFRHLEARAAVHPAKGEQCAFKQTLIEYLYRHVPGLHRPQAASDKADARKPLLSLRSQFNRLYQIWAGLGRPAVLPLDGRAGNRGREGYQHEECDRLITAHAARLRGDHGAEGNLGLAIKLLFEKGAICSDCWLHYGPGRLSTRNRQRLKPNKIQVAYFKDPDAVRKISPTHHTEWDTRPGDRFVIDDMTTNEITWDEIDGERITGQAQLLFSEDEYSAYPLPFLLYFGHPNGETIKKAVALVLKHVGLPRVSFLTERGVFANRKLAGQRGVERLIPFREFQSALEGLFRFDALPDDALAEIRKRDLGLRDPAFRLKIEQAGSPQAKTVERSFYEFQKSASRLSGFAGFNQRNEKPRWMQDFDRRVQIGKEHPGNEYLHLSALRKNYETIMAEIAARPVNGMRHRGLSPRQLWEEELSRRPLLKLPPEIEAFFATHRIPGVKVQTQGIMVKLNRHERAFYFDENTGPLVGRRVAVRINYDLPEYIHIEHPDTKKLIKVKRDLTKRTAATPAELAASTAARRAHVNGALGEIGNVKNLFTAWQERDSMHSPADVEHGAQIIADAGQHKDDQARAARDKKKLSQKAAILGTTIAAAPRNAARVSEGLDLEAEALKEIEAMKGQTP